MAYAELQVTTHFSFLRGASSCEELFRQAALLGCLRWASSTAIRWAGWCARWSRRRSSPISACDPDDRGVPARSGRRHFAAGLAGGRAPPGRASPGLLTLGKSRADPQHGEKGKCFLHWEDVAEPPRGWSARWCRASPIRGDRIGAALDGGCVRRARPCLPDPASPPRRRDAAPPTGEAGASASA
jgi:hypothetical protein